MARKPRIENEGAVYHVMNRGDRGGGVLEDGRNCERIPCGRDHSAVVC
jgi:hypothetical protein